MSESDLKKRKVNLTRILAEQELQVIEKGRKERMNYINNISGSSNCARETVTALGPYATFDFEGLQDFFVYGLNVDPIVIRDLDSRSLCRILNAAVRKWKTKSQKTLLDSYLKRNIKTFIQNEMDTTQQSGGNAGKTHSKKRRQKKRGTSRKWRLCRCE